MRVSQKQLKHAVDRIKTDLQSYKQQSDDLVLDISITQEDPGDGVMVECLTIKASKIPEVEKSDEGEVTMSIEVYPASEKLDPVANLVKAYKVLRGY